MLQIAITRVNWLVGRGEGALLASADGGGGGLGGGGGAGWRQPKLQLLLCNANMLFNSSS